LKTYYKIIVSLFCIALVAQSCSRKKDKFINRNFHALGTKYNVLYNGDLALQRGKEAVNDAFTENFWELLPIERMKLQEDIFLPGQSKNADFDKAEEKAIKAIQVHGMNIKGKEKNPQIDEAYLLLGKARYYDQRFVPALAAFNNILNKYPTSDKINQVKIWREKASIRLDNNEGALKKLKRLLYEEELKDQDLADAKAALAQAYINLKHKDSALIELAIAAEYTKIKNEKARFHFIRGQLYNEFGKKDSANIEFNAIIDMHRQIPRAFYINAHLQKSYNFDTANGDIIEFKEYLTDLEENRENRPFLDLKLKEKALEEQKENALKQQQNLSAQNANSNQINTRSVGGPPTRSRNIQSKPGGSGSSFYFYNTTTVAYGKNEFLKLWGDRKLQDNWRLSDQRADIATSTNTAIVKDILKIMLRLLQKPKIKLKG